MHAQSSREPRLLRDAPDLTNNGESVELADDLLIDARGENMDEDERRRASEKQRQKDFIGPTWVHVLARIDKALNLYSRITCVRNRRRQYKYVDLVIRLQIVKAYVLTILEKSMKASTVLEEVGEQLEKIRNGELRIIQESSVRYHAFHYPEEILTQKYHLVRGHWYLKIGSENTKQMALKEFLSCLNNPNLYDARIEQECLVRIQKIIGRNSLVPKLELMLSRYKQRPRDFIFLIDQFSYFNLMSKHLMQQSVKHIFDNHVNENDRICLVKFNGEKFTRTVFSLVRKGSNRVQLRNQLRTLDREEHHIEKLLNEEKVDA